MTRRRKRLVDATVAALFLLDHHDMSVSPATVRSWAQRGHIGRYDDGVSGAHYDLNELAELARRRAGGENVAS